MASLTGLVRRAVERVGEDVRTALLRDPAARSPVEVVLAYPGIHALWLHRLAHGLHGHGFVVTARCVSHAGRLLTGIEIHPGARIGRRTFIDHGMGVVIGETAEVGDDCLIYQGVVLGGTSAAREKRHPTLRHGVTVGANACILGPIEIGEGARVGAGSVVIKSVPDEATVVGVPGRIVRSREPHPEPDLDHGRLPDPISLDLRRLLRLESAFERRVRRLEERLGIEDRGETETETEFLVSDDLFEEGSGI